MNSFQKYTPPQQLRAGFTLIELLVYVAFSSVLLSAVVSYLWNIRLGQAKSETNLLVVQQLRLSTRRIDYELRNASDILSVTNTELCLASADLDRHPTRVYVSNSQLRIAWGGGSSDCTLMTNDEALTALPVQVQQLAFTDNSQPTSKNITYQLTLEMQNDRSEWVKTETYESSSELRTP